MWTFSHRTIAALGLASLLAAAPGAMAQPAPVNEILAAAGPVAVGTQTVRIALEPGAAGPLSRRLADIGGRRLYLVLGNLEAAASPGIAYEVYLGLPPGAVPAANDPHFVGTFSFFFVAPPNTTPRSLSYDVTALASRLASQALPDGRLAVTIVPTQPSPPAAATRAAIGRIALAVQ